MSERPASNDPWVIERKRASTAEGFRRPDVGSVPRPYLYLLGVLAASRALGLVLIAEAVARGIAVLASGDAGNAETTRFILVIGIIGALVRSVAEWATTASSRKLATRVKRDLRASLWHRIAADGSKDGGDAVVVADGLDDLDEYFLQTIPAVISAAVVPLLVGVRILGADWLSALVIVLTVPLVPLFMVLIGKHTQQRTDAALNALTKLAGHLTELARGLPVLVGLGRVAQQTAALDDIQRQYRTRTQETLRWAFLSALALELIATISVAIVAVFLGLRLLNGTMELDAAILALILAPECFNALRQVGTAFHASQDGLSALERAKKLLQRPSSSDIRRARSDAPELVSVSVRYAGRTRNAVDAVSGSLRGITAVGGPSGAGKSTLLAALVGALPSDALVEGTITGVDPERTAWAPQAPRVFASTPREELALYGADVSVLAELDLEPRADANFAELSPGEQRRLAVARALARVDAGATLLVLDEPTAHLDRAAAGLVRQAILRRADRSTIVMATHDPATFALANNVIELADGHRSAVAREEADALDPVTRQRESQEATERSETQVGAPSLSLISLLKPHGWLWFGSVILAAVAAGLAAALTAVSGWLIVRASVEEYIMYLLVAIVGVRAFGIGRAVGRYVERLVTHAAAFEVVDALRLRLWRAIAKRGAGSRRLLEGGAPLDYLVTLADDLRDQLPRILPPIGAGVIVLAGGVVTTALVLPHLTLLVGLTLTLSALIAVVAALWAEHGAGARRVEARSRMIRGTSSLADSAADLRGNGVSSAALHTLDHEADRLAAAESRTAWSAGLGSALVTFAATALAVIVPVLSVGVSAEYASVIALLMLAIIEPLVGMVSAVHRIPGMRALLKRFGAVLRPVPEATWGEERIGDVSEVVLEDVSVRYPGVSEAAVSGVSGSAERGSWCVISGPSGSGKSTLLSAIMGALPVERGTIRAGQVPLPKLRHDEWRMHTAWCPQDAYVFDSSLRGNLTISRPRTDRLDDTEMTDALHMVGLSRLLDSMSDGLDAQVGAGGSALSGGERQRLAVARALLSRADVILLDEPTAHLDQPTAAAMMADIRAATSDKVVLLVSHRAVDRHPEDVLVELPAR